jgi:hypothetical protein
VSTVARKKRIPCFTTEATVDVDIDPEDLHHAGWHHEDECDASKGDGGEIMPPLLGLRDAVASLHRQAHPGQHSSVTMCHEEPCRSLTLDQLRGQAVAS